MGESVGGVSGSISLTAFRLLLPQDGTHRKIVGRARAAGLPFTHADGDRVVQMCKGTDNTPALGYTIDLPAAEDLERVAERLCACAILAQNGIGIVPELAPEGESTDREKLERMRNVLRITSDAIEALLEATRP